MFKNKEGKIRSGWKIAGVTAALFGVVIIIALLFGIAMIFYLIASGDFQIETLSFSTRGQNILNSYQLIITYTSEFAMILTPIIAWKFIMKRPLTNMGLSSIKNGYKDLLTGLLFGALSISIVFVAIILSSNAVVESWKPQFSIDTLTYLVLFVLVGFAEEIYGRGFIMAALRQTRSIPVVVIISSLIFSLLHSANAGIGLVPYLNIFLVGVLFAYMYLKSGNIWTGIGYHITWNYFQGNVYGFLVSGTNTKGMLTTRYEVNNLWNGGEFGPEGGFFVTIVIISGLILTALLFKNRQFDFIATEPERNKIVLPTDNMNIDIQCTNRD
jgi:uncharacterized protein